jgi:lysophospholipase L1-like esterase
MPNVVLLGDSVFDNAAYTSGGPTVIDQVSQRLPPRWSAMLLAVDGATSDDVARQLARVSSEATHLVLSVGGNDALRHTGILELRVKSARETLLMLADAVADFAPHYARAVAACLELQLPLVLCTIYHGNFPEPDFQRAVRIALAAFNEVIIEQAIRHSLKVIDLRLICREPEDYANPIEPSSIGGAKIASAIVHAVTIEPVPSSGGALICKVSSDTGASA